MKHLKRFNENRIKIKSTDIDGLLVDIVDKGFTYNIQNSEIGINIDKLVSKGGYCYNINTIYDTIKTLEDFVSAYDSNITYDVYVLEDDIDADGDLHEMEYKYSSVDDISDGVSEDYDIVYINIKIRY